MPWCLPIQTLFKRRILGGREFVYLIYRATYNHRASLGRAFALAGTYQAEKEHITESEVTAFLRLQPAQKKLFSIQNGHHMFDVLRFSILVFVQMVS